MSPPKKKIMCSEKSVEEKRKTNVFTRGGGEKGEK
jgi:hypothetical protein